MCLTAVGTSLFICSNWNKTEECYEPCDYWEHGFNSQNLNLDKVLTFKTQKYLVTYGYSVGATKLTFPGAGGVEWTVQRHLSFKLRSSKVTNDN